MLCGASVLSKSGKQSQMTDSTGYADMVTLHEASVWAVVMRKHLGSMFAEQSEPTLIFEDNAAAVRFAEKGPGPRSLHWDVKLEYVTELQKLQYVNVLKVDTKKQIADVLTKALPVDQHLVCSGALLGSEIVFSSVH